VTVARLAVMAAVFARGASNEKATGADDVKDPLLGDQSLGTV
jgi:hypothetical protein